MQCKEVRERLGAYLDGELDERTTPLVAGHVSGCTACNTELQGLRQLQQSLRTHGRWSMPPGFDAELRQRLHDSDTEDNPRAVAVSSDDTPRSNEWGRFVAGLAAGLVLGVTLYLTLVQPTLQGHNLAGRVVALHVQSQLADHLVDVASSDQHQVKPWFQGRINYTVPVYNLADAGFPLLGGRVDYLDGRNVAALVFRHRQHRINLFVWPTAGAGIKLPASETLRGYNLVAQSHNGLDYVAVSDLNQKELETFLRTYLTQAS